MTKIQKLLENNLAWADSIKQKQPEYFSKLSQQQTPDYLWIGCSDSRLPANQIIDLPPGEVFVHRNIANVVVHSDLNCLSVIQYAVEVLKVKHIIVCGHYGCGGVHASMGDEEHGLIDNWLRHLKDVSRLYANELDQLDEQAKFNRLCELNVIEQVKNVSHSPIIEKAWESKADLTVHGWIYSLKTGLITDLDVSVSGAM